MKKYQNIIIFAVVFVVIICYPMLMFGQPGGPPNGGGGPLGGPVGAPIDGGISALIAGGIALVIRKFYKNKKDKNITV